MKSRRSSPRAHFDEAPPERSSPVQRARKFSAVFGTTSLRSCKSDQEGISSQAGEGHGRAEQEAENIPLQAVQIHKEPNKTRPALNVLNFAKLLSLLQIAQKAQHTVISMRPRGVDPAETSKKTTGFDMVTVFPDFTGGNSRKARFLTAFGTAESAALLEEAASTQHAPPQRGFGESVRGFVSERPSSANLGQSVLYCAGRAIVGPLESVCGAPGAPVPGSMAAKLPCSGLPAQMNRTRCYSGLSAGLATRRSFAGKQLPLQSLRPRPERQCRVVSSVRSGSCCTNVAWKHSLEPLQQ